MHTAEKLPVAKIIAAAFILPIQLGSTLFKAIAVPLVMIILVTLISGMLSSATPSTLNVLISLVTVFVMLAINASIGVIIHRLVLIGPGSAPPSPGFQFGQREWLYVIKSIQIAIACVAIGMVLIFLMSILVLPFTGIELDPNKPVPIELTLLVGVFALLPAGYFMARLNLMLPAIATDQSTHFDQAWHLADGHALRLLVATMIPISVTLGLNYMLSKTDSVILVLLLQLISMAVALVGVFALALSYQWLKKQDDAYYQDIDEPPAE